MYIACIFVQVTLSDKSDELFLLDLVSGQGDVTAVIYNYNVNN